MVTQIGERPTEGTAGAGAQSGTVIHLSLVGDVVITATFEDVYRREYPGLIAVAAAMTGDRDAAQDLVQDTMVRAWVHWGKVSILDRPGAWCHRVLVNACRSRLRRRVTEWRYLARERRVEVSTPGPSPDTIAFWTAARTLPSRPRSVVAMYFAGDLTSREIGEILGIPEGTVRSDLSAARRVIMHALRGSDD